jgi:hypothetical protein
MIAQLYRAIGLGLRSLQFERASAALIGLFEIEIDARVAVAAAAWAASACLPKRIALLPEGAITTAAEQR